MISDSIQIHVKFEPLFSHSAFYGPKLVWCTILGAMSWEQGSYANVYGDDMPSDSYGESDSDEGPPRSEPEPQSEPEPSDGLPSTASVENGQSNGTSHQDGVILLIYIFNGGRWVPVQARHLSTIVENLDYHESMEYMEY